MKPALRFSPLPGILGFVAMAALGWFVADSGSPSSVPAGRSADAGKRDRSERRERRGEDVVAAQVRAVRSAGSPKERLRSAVALAKSIPASDFAAWVEGDRFDFREGPELSVFRMILFERWINEAPETLIPWAGKNNYGQAGRALQALAKNSPAVLMDHYRSHPDDGAELQVLAEVAKNHPELALQRFQELSSEGLSRTSSWQVSGLIEQLSLKSPAALEAAMSRLPSGLQAEAEKQLCMRRLETSFDTELQALLERPDGASVFASIASQKPGFTGKLLDDLAGLPEQWKATFADNPYSLNLSSDGARWYDADLEGAGFTKAQASDIRNACLREMARSNPEFVLRNLDGVEPRVKASFIASAMGTAGGDEAAAEKLISLLGNEEDKQQARNQLKLSHTARTPDEWLEQVGSDPTALTDTYRTFEHLNKWGEEDIGKLRKGFQNLPDDGKLAIARLAAQAGRHMSISPAFAGDAIRYLVEHPPENNPGNQVDPVSASSIHAVNLMQDDPVAATAWVNSLPEGKARTWAYKNMASNWNQHDPKAVREWLKTLPADTRQAVKVHLEQKR
ncbi:MAG: hypothetical protein EOP88_04690 [Verrucomicrobiaceae bacterium]|nr:MAG: hypothetical protein EOP88_04690 [Verrucomicrobiaceae bacterium]